MTDKEKLLRIKKLADEMYRAAQYLTTDASHLHKAMDEYHQFIVHDYHKEEPVSEGLEEAVNAYIGYAPEVDESSSTYGKRQAFKAGAKWQKETLWKPANGDNLPEIDREVIALTQPYPLEGNEYAVSFAHRPNPDGWDGKSIITGNIEHYTPKTYDKGGWNIPNVKYWLDCLILKETEL